MRAGMFVMLLVPLLAVLVMACTKEASRDTSSASQDSATTGGEAPAPKAFKEVKFLGSSFPIVEAKGQTTTLHSLRSGSARVDALLIYRTHVETRNAEGNRRPPETKKDCPDTCGSSNESCKYGVDLVSMTWVQTYNDGSAFTGALPTDPDDAAKRGAYFDKSFVCTNGSDFYIEVHGIIIDGKGARFEGLTGGTWHVEATTSTYITEGEFSATLEY